MDTYCVMSTIIQAAAHWRQGMFELIFFLGRGRGEPNSTLSLCFFTQKSSFFVVFLSPVYLCNYAVVVFPLWQRHIIHALHYVPAILAGQRRLMMQLHRRLDRAEAATLTITEVMGRKGQWQINIAFEIRLMKWNEPMVVLLYMHVYVCLCVSVLHVTVRSELLAVLCFVVIVYFIVPFGKSRLPVVEKPATGK